MSPMSVVVPQNACLKPVIAAAAQKMQLNCVERAQGGDAVIAVLREAGTNDGAEALGAPIISFWGDNHRASNPFADDQVRGVLSGAPPDIAQITTTLRHLQHGELPSLHGLLGEDVQLHTLLVSHTQQKSACLEAFSQFMQEHAVPAYVQRDLEVIVDELFSNAIYNAPTDGKKRLFRSTSRRQSVVSPRPAVVQFAVDARYACVAVRDAYGSLDPQDVISSLRRCYGRRQAEASQKAGGAGLGFFMMLERSSQLIVNISAGEFTEIIALRDLRQRRREFAKAAPSFNLCVADPTRRPYSARWDRIPVELPAFVTRHGRVELGVVRDMCVPGAFITLPKASTRGWQLGDRVDLTLAGPDAASPVATQATVCWVGYSEEHDCEGFGVQFADDQQRVDFVQAAHRFLENV